MKLAEFAKIVAGLRAAYSKDFLPDKESYELWYRSLGALPYEIVEMAALRHIQTNRFAPTIADITSLVAEITAPELGLTVDDAWSMVVRAIRDGNYHAQERWEELSPLVQRCVTPTQIREYAMMSTDSLESVAQSHFRRSFTAAQDSAKKDAMTSPVLLGRIEQAKALTSEDKMITEDAVGRSVGISITGAY